VKIHHIVADNETTPEELHALYEAFMSARTDPVEAAVVTRPGVTVTSFEVNPEDEFHVTSIFYGTVEDFSAEGIEPPALGTYWKHTNGNEYRVLIITNVNTKDASKYPTTVVYINDGNGKAYSRPLSRWYASMTQLMGNAR
jgi:hypothetical protein